VSGQGERYRWMLELSTLEWVMYVRYQECQRSRLRPPIDQCNRLCEHTSVYAREQVRNTSFDLLPTAGFNFRNVAKVMSYVVAIASQVSPLTAT
jgi:hypothetical protein